MLIYYCVDVDISLLFLTIGRISKYYTFTREIYDDARALFYNIIYYNNNTALYLRGLFGESRARQR